MADLEPSFRTPGDLQQADLPGIKKSLKVVLRSHKRLHNVSNARKKRKRHTEFNKMIDVLIERVLNPVAGLAAPFPVSSLFSIFGSSRTELKFEVD